jgi:hypothetical protein
MYPSTTQLTTDDWVAFFDQRPDVMHQLLGDIFSYTKAAEAEVKKTGRRPKHTKGSLDELWTMITPRYSMDPFHLSILDLMGNRSLRSFAARIPMHHVQLMRLIKGERNLVSVHDSFASMATLEQIARAGGVHPAYFREWRELYIMSLLNQIFSENPSYSVAMVKKLRDIRQTWEV